MSDDAVSPASGPSITREIPVEWGDCDAAGVVFYPHYYRWFDVGTHALLTSLGLDHHTLRDALGLVGTPLVRAGASFHSSATFGDVLTASSAITRVGDRSFTVSHRMHIGDRLVAEGEETRVFAQRGDDGRMRSADPGPAVRARLRGESAPALP